MNESNHNNQMKKNYQYFLLALLFSFPLLIQFFARLISHPFELSFWIQWALATLTFFGPGIRIYKDTWKGKKSDLLIAIGTSCAYLISIFSFFGLHPFMYFDLIVVVITFNLLGKWLTSILEKNQSQQIYHYEKQLLEKISTFFLVFNLAIALFTFLFYWIYNGHIENAFINALAVLMIAGSIFSDLAISSILVFANAIGIVTTQNPIISKKIKWNFFFTFFFNALTVPLATLGLIDPYIAAWTLAASLTTLFANTLLLRYSKSKDIL